MRNRSWFFGTVGYKMGRISNRLCCNSAAACFTFSLPGMMTPCIGVELWHKCSPAAFSLNKLISLFKDNSDPAYSSLENLTWYAKEKEMLKKYTSVFQLLDEEQGKLEQDRMGLGVKVRSILVNLGAISIDELYTKSDIEDGVKKNKAGRKFIYPKDFK